MPGFSVYHTVSEAERKTVQCMVDSSEKGNADIIKSDSGRVLNARRTLVGMQTVLGSILNLSIPQNCNLRKFVHLLSKVLRKAYTRNSSAGRRIGCMLRQHSFHYASRPSRYRWAAFKENYVCKTM